MFRIVATCLAGLVLAVPAAALDLSAPPTRQQLDPPSGAISREFIRGPRGGCYYINGNGNKTYVDRGKCR